MLNRSKEEQESLNQQLFELLDEGQILSTEVYQFCQIFFSKEFEPLKETAKKMLEKAFMVEQILQDDDGRFYFHAIKELHYSKEELSAISLEMLAIANDFKVTYMGWAIT